MSWRPSGGHQLLQRDGSVADIVSGASAQLAGGSGMQLRSVPRLAHRRDLRRAVQSLDAALVRQARLLSQAAGLAEAPNIPRATEAPAPTRAPTNQYTQSFGFAINNNVAFVGGEVADRAIIAPGRSLSTDERSLRSSGRPVRHLQMPSQTCTSHGASSESQGHLSNLEAVVSAFWSHI